MYAWSCMVETSNLFALRHKQSRGNNRDTVKVLFNVTVIHRVYVVASKLCCSFENVNKNQQPADISNFIHGQGIIEHKNGN